MIISLSREADKEALSILLDDAETCIRLYKKTGSIKMKEQAERTMEIYDEIKHKVDTHDYTKLDQQRQKMDKILYAYTNSK